MNQGMTFLPSSITHISEPVFKESKLKKKKKKENLETNLKFIMAGWMTSDVLLFYTFI